MIISISLGKFIQFINIIHSQDCDVQYIGIMNRTIQVCVRLIGVVMLPSNPIHKYGLCTELCTKCRQ